MSQSLAVVAVIIGLWILVIFVNIILTFKTIKTKCLKVANNTKKTWRTVFKSEFSGTSERLRDLGD